MHSKKTALYLGLFCTTQIYSVSANATLIKLDLDTLRADNSGISSATAVSADGRVVVGNADNDQLYTQAFRHNEGDSKMTALGTLKSDNSGYSGARAVSADGRVVVGFADSDNGYVQAFRHNEGDSKMNALGTLRADNSGYSSANAVSANGWVVVGEADNDNRDRQAFRHDKGDTKMTGLGTLKTDNSGNSLANAVSANGRVVVGQAQNDQFYMQAFRHNEGDSKMTALGTLKSDNSGNSFANAVSADGRVVVGDADNDKGYRQAFRHDKGDSKMTALGTLKSDNSGSSSAYAVSADGRVVVGEASNDNDQRYSQAFRHNEGDTKMIALGTLKSDNSGYSGARAVSADGRVVVGSASNDNDPFYMQAFRHNEGDSKMTALGTLKSDNSGASSAMAVSADGRIVVGEAHNNLGQSRAVIWKTAKAVDVDYTIESMIKSTDKAQQVLGVYEGQLFSLADQNCRLDANKDYCLGIYTNYNNVKSSDLYASGLIGALRIANTGWTVGGAVNFNLSDDLVGGYHAHGFDLPGVGAFVRYNENKDSTGFNSELKGSYLKQKMTITREALDGAEHGEGKTKLSGYLIDLGFGYGIQANKWLVTPKVNLRHHQITRDGYAENRHADFLASYEEMGNQNTDLALSVNSKYALSPKVNLEAEVGSYMTLENDQKDAVVKIDYIGEYSSKKSYEQADFRPFVKLSSSYAVTPNSSIGMNVAWHKTTYSQDFTQAGFVYSYHW